MNTEILQKNVWPGFFGKHAALAFCFVIDFDRGMTCLYPCLLSKCLRLPDWPFFYNQGQKLTHLFKMGAFIKHLVHLLFHSF